MIIKSCNAQREGNDNGENTTIGLIGKKATLQVQHTFCTFLCRCFARLQRETSRNFLVTRFVEEITYVFLFIFHCRSFPPWWPVAFCHFLTAATNFSCCSSKKEMYPLFFTHFSSLSLSVSFHSPVSYVRNSCLG